MGQRLIVTVNTHGHDICKIYYHWSAYSVSALYETKKIIEAIGECKDIKELRLKLIRFCEETGGGIDGGKDSNEWNYITNEYPDETFKSEGIDRSYGLIAISKEGMKNLQSWCEGEITLYIDECNIFNDVIWYYGSIDDYNNDMRENGQDEIEFDDIPKMYYDPCDFDFCDIDYIIDAFEHAPDYVVSYAGGVYQLIA